MPIDRIEIYPGVTIDVNRRHKHRTGIPRSAVLLKCSESERRAILMGMARDQGANVKYSTLLLDEAVALSKKVGEKEAARITGVKYWSLKGRKRTLIREGKYERKNPVGVNPKYTLAQKQRCVQLAKQIADKYQCGMRPAFKRAGKILGVNGRSIEWMHQQRMF